MLCKHRSSRLPYARKHMLVWDKRGGRMWTTELSANMQAGHTQELWLPQDFGSVFGKQDTLLVNPGRSAACAPFCLILCSQLCAAVRMHSTFLPCVKGLQPTHDNYNRKPSVPLLHTRSPVANPLIRFRNRREQHGRSGLHKGNARKMAAA